MSFSSGASVSESISWQACSQVASENKLLSEKGFFNSRICNDLIRRSFFEYLTIVYYVCPVCYRKGVSYIMVCYLNSQALVSQIIKHLFQFYYFYRVYTCKGFIKEQEERSYGNGPCYLGLSPFTS